MRLSHFTFNIVIGFILFGCSFSIHSTHRNSRRQSREINKWTSALGHDLKRLGETVTKMLEIKQMYEYAQAQVRKKDPEVLLNQIVRTVATMMRSKINAVRRVVEAAEEEAEKFDYANISDRFRYYSALYSIGSDNNESGIAPTDGQQEFKGYLDMFKPMELDYDTHFYNLAVNTSHSAVYVPYNIFDLNKNASYTIQWSEALDKIFVDNYSRDPALFWQYFGAANGILRLYPAKKWEEHVSPAFDCRTRTWFIEAATCTKDVVILIDFSGSMEGMRKHIATLTVYSILDTLSNNDFVNVLSYNKWTNYTVPCFKDILAQATRENIDIFKKALGHMKKPENHTFVGQALETAFELLHSVREKRGCIENFDQCSQAIMLVTDDVTSNVSDIVMKHNFLNNGTIKPVRLFTYLVGKEVPDLSDILWLACSNRGYHTNVRALEQITTSVLEYINVIARPLVLNGSHPASWTHAYSDTTVDEKTKDYRLLTSVAIPAFDRKANKNTDQRVANLLGVAGTDIPINDIGRLTFPYKIGVNGYSFIVSNNGYVLKHPNLQPMVEAASMLKKNYNSIDLMEVEQFDDDLKPRELNPQLVELRRQMAFRKTGNLHNISIKYHYDKIHRISKEIYNYYYAPIEDTPFTLGLALPKTYGHYSIYVKDVIQKNKPTGTNLTSFFEGENWKIHPDWVYCKFHYLEGHEYDTPELELLDFLGKMYNQDFVWEKQYSESGGDVLHGREDYYCDKELVQRLVFDADNTKNAFPGTFTFNANEEPIIKKYNVTLRFLATMSGLTRWEYIYSDPNNTQEFGDHHYKAIDETWYKSAVLNHEKSSEAFVFSIHIRDSNWFDSWTAVTASHALFLSDAGNEAPAAVVGYQFMHKSFRNVFFNITGQASHTCQECLACSSEQSREGLHCYVIDSDGYIVISSDNEDSGIFFGKIDGEVMDSLTDKGYFDTVTVYDYQAYCEEPDDEASSAGSLYLGMSILNYIISWISWLILEFCIYSIHYTWSLQSVLGEEIFPPSITSTTTPTPMTLFDYDYDGDEEVRPQYMACEQQSKLFILQQDRLGNDLYPPSIDIGYRNYYVAKIPYTNLILVAVNGTPYVSNGGMDEVSNDPTEIEYSNNYTELPCQKRKLNDLPRSRLHGCINFHEREEEITTCGKPKQSSSTTNKIDDYLTTICIFIELVNFMLVIR